MSKVLTRSSDLQSITSKDIPARKRWRGKVFTSLRSKRRPKPEAPVRVIYVIEPDEHVVRFQRKIAEYDSLIAELKAQLKPLEKKRAQTARQLERRKRALGTRR